MNTKATLFAWDLFEEERKILFQLLEKYSYRYSAQPFRLRSGGMSHVYFDGRQTALTAKGSFLIGGLFSSLISYHAPEAVAIGGLTLGADPLVSSVLVNVGMSEVRRHHNPPTLHTGFLVRKEEKGHGVKDLLVGGNHLPDMAQVVVCDDVITTGDSMLTAVRAARKHTVFGEERTFEVRLALALIDREENNGKENIEKEVPIVISLFRKSEFEKGMCEPISTDYRYGTRH